MKDTITYQDFDKLDLRVGKVVEASAPDWSEKLLELKVEFGEAIGQRIIMAGVKQWYQPAEFKGNQYIFIVNLAERKMGPGVSQGMMLMADDGEKPLPIQVDADAPLGCVVR